MSLPTPNLDDRTWKDIVEEAKRMIPALCPNWTDFNPSDPGITLVELMAWMSEMIIYRLNRVPEKNYIQFMELMGVTLKPPEPASTWLVFDVVPGGENVDLPHIPPNTRVSGTSGDGETITFETIEPLNLNAAQPVRFVSQLGEKHLDLTEDIASHSLTSRMNIFDGGEPIPHEFYIGDPEIAETGDQFLLRLFVDLEAFGSGLNLQWSCWNGDRWIDIQPADGTDVANMEKNGEIEFRDLPKMKELEIFGYKTYWMRVKLLDYKGEPLPRIKSLKRVLELTRTSGIVPDRGYRSSAEVPFVPVPFTGTIAPFGTEGKTGDALYFGSTVFGRKGVPVSIDIRLAGTYKPSDYEDLENLKVTWEYYGEKGEWEMLGDSAQTGTAQSFWDFRDPTEAFTHSGKVVFYVPDDIVATEINGERSFWMRIRIRSGSYGSGKKKNPPLLDSFLIHYKEKPSIFNYYLTYNRYEYKDLTLPATGNEVLQAFEPVGTMQPEFYMGFNSPFSNKLHRLYFRLSQKGKASSSVTWEYYSTEGWKSLNLQKDDTRHFVYQGQVEFIGPPDWDKCRQYETEAYWLRVRWNMYDHESLPNLLCIHMNPVLAINAVSTRDEILGYSNGEPFQRYSLGQAPILPNAKILVKEIESTVPQEIEDFIASLTDDENIVEELDPQSGEVRGLWVEWKDVHNFFQSRKDSRHFILDIYDGEVTFGDGINGRIPAVGKEIKLGICYAGGGNKGNMPTNSINNLETAYPFINRVSNPYPASGGCDMETIEAAKMRAPWELKHRERAVTAEDFEQLAYKATGEVARANCSTREEGIVQLILIPAGEEDRLVPSPTLCESVRKYLDQRRLITTKLEVAGPEYIEFSIQTEVVLLQNMVDKLHQIKNNIVNQLKTFFHPLRGGLYEKGWPMGRTVHLSELYYVIENVSGVDYVTSLVLNHIPGKERISIDENSYPYLSDIEIRVSGEH
jgi:hypothetical protein